MCAFRKFKAILRIIIRHINNLDFLSMVSTVHQFVYTDEALLLDTADHRYDKKIVFQAARCICQTVSKVRIKKTLDCIVL